MCASRSWSKPPSASERWRPCILLQLFCRILPFEARGAGHWCWENCQLWSEDPCTNGSNPVFVKSTAERWIRGHMQGCWARRWKLKYATNTKSKPMSSKAAAEHWVEETAGACSAGVALLKTIGSATFFICKCTRGIEVTICNIHIAVNTICW